MSLHHDLLTLSRDLVNRNTPPARATPIEAELRRAISTAYYALFHLLIDEIANRTIAIPALRAKILRSFDHGDMKKVCAAVDSLPQDASGDRVYPSGQVVPAGLLVIAQGFCTLQEARLLADYDTFTAVTLLQSESSLQRAENAFASWATVNNDPATDIFLIDHLCKGLRKR
jgi:hypothetical protein